MTNDKIINNYRFFSIHGIIGVSVHDNYPWIDTLYNDLPKEFNVDKSSFEKCQSKVEIVYSKNVHEKKTKKRFLFADNSIIDFKFGCKIFFSSPQVIQLFCRQECNEWMMFCISYLLNINGFSFLHAACFEKNNKCILLPSGSGAGKTMVTLDFVKNKGFSLLGDDLCIINKDGNVYSYPKKMVLYPWHLGQTSKIKKNIFSSQFKEFIKSILRKFPKLLAHFRSNNPSLKTVSPYDFFGEDKIKSTAKASSLIYLERSKNTTKNVGERAIIIKSVLSIYHELFKYFDNCFENVVREHNFFDGYSFYNETRIIMDSLVNSCSFKFLNINDDIKGSAIADIVYEEIKKQ